MKVRALRTDPQKTRAIKKALIPDEPNVPPSELTEYVLTIFGEKGIGKTSLAAQFEGALILQLEPRRRNLRVWQKAIRPRSLRELKQEERKVLSSGGQLITPWQEIVTVIEQAIEDDRVKCLVIDTVDRAYDACLTHWCYSLGISDPSEQNDYGATWRMIRDDFEEALNRILYAEEQGIRKGLILISHAHYREIESRGGLESYELLVPTCAPAAFKTIKAISDFAFYYGYYQNKRALYLRGSDHIWAACGTDEHFISREGEPLSVILMGNSPREAYENLTKAYNNELSSSSGEVSGVPETGQAEKAPKKRKVVKSVS